MPCPRTFWCDSVVISYLAPRDSLSLFSPRRLKGTKKKKKNRCFILNTRTEIPWNLQLDNGYKDSETQPVH